MRRNDSRSVSNSRSHFLPLFPLSLSLSRILSSDRLIFFFPSRKIEPKTIDVRSGPAPYEISLARSLFLERSTRSLTASVSRANEKEETEGIGKREEKDSDCSASHDAKRVRKYRVVKSLNALCVSPSSSSSSFAVSLLRTRSHFAIPHIRQMLFRTVTVSLPHQIKLHAGSRIFSSPGE